jgi:hypothetical protein
LVKPSGSGRRRPDSGIPGGLSRLFSKQRILFLTSEAAP